MDVGLTTSGIHNGIRKTSLLTNICPGPLILGEYGQLLPYKKPTGYARMFSNTRTLSYSAKSTAILYHHGRQLAPSSYERPKRLCADALQSIAFCLSCRHRRLRIDVPTSHTPADQEEDLVLHTASCRWPR